MLIFVDKRKEIRRKIKIICITLSIIFLLAINFFHFQKALSANNKNLIDYHSHRITNNWYNNADIVYLLNSHTQKYTKVILLPQVFNRENATTLALAFSKIPSKTTFLKFTDEISVKEDIKKLASLFFPLAEKQQAEQQVVISTSFTKTEKYIQQNHLFPLTLNYKHTQKLNNLANLTQQLDTIFPPIPEPKNKLEKDKLNLQKFSTENFMAIRNIIFQNQKPSFALQNIFLSNARFCLKGKNNTECKFHSRSSFEKNLYKLAHRFSPQNPPQKLILLTEDILISAQDYTNITQDEGLHFIFNNHEAFLFPKEIISLAERKKALYIIKERAGINPKYHTDTMKLYKFKTLEIDLNDNI